MALCLAPTLEFANGDDATQVWYPLHPKRCVLQNISRLLVVSRSNPRDLPIHIPE